MCAVNGGAAVIKGDLILAPGSALNATFALNDVAGIRYVQPDREG